MSSTQLSLRPHGHLGSSCVTPCARICRPVPFCVAGGCRRQRHYPTCRGAAGGGPDEPAADDGGLASLFSQTVRVKGIPSPVAAVQSAQPSPLVPPHAVVKQVLDVLQRNDYPDQDAGVTAAFHLTAPAEDPQHAGTVRSWVAGGEPWLPLARFHALMHTAYRPLLNCDRWRPVSPLVFPSTRHENKAVQAVEVVARPRHGPAASSDTALRSYTYTFCLERLDSGPCKDCWMVAGVRVGNYAI
ncbi:hypothetical protein HYH02_001531 [Chlamydomonas schloesseri]|uniref:Uncharacterized protein n=1 Tax=Chlamydomonas schloesseri TaxID=2026947 RepID=A0A836BBW4_9CHLO|nr:hypothetical protein HYH02_001531 [Chlamydomonas schloesseri]|eukprot:KAG2453305.1 hypothetical protein HYH02_001531 [Chlamydomonas schloesseri]